MFKFNFSKKLMNCPTFPDEVLCPFTPSFADTKNATPAESHEPSKEETNSKIPHSPPQTSKKGKEKLHEYLGSIPAADVTLSSPPKKKVRISTFSKNKRSQLQAVEIAHYYSSDDDHPLSAPTSPEERSKVSSKGHMIEKEVVHSDSKDSDMAITKQVGITAKSLQQMAKAIKQRPGLRSSS